MLARLNCPAMSAAVAGLACVVRAWRTGRMRSGRVAGQSALVAALDFEEGVGFAGAFCLPLPDFPAGNSTSVSTSSASANDCCV